MSSTKRTFILLLIAVVLLLSNIALKYVPKQYEPNNVSILIFDAVAMIPNDFFLEAKIGRELSFIGRAPSRILVGGQISQTVLADAKAHAVSEDSQCGIQIIFSHVDLPHGPFESAILYTDKNYMYLGDDKDLHNLAGSIVKSICSSRKLIAEGKIPAVSHP